MQPVLFSKFFFGHVMETQVSDAFLRELSEEYAGRQVWLSLTVEGIESSANKSIRLSLNSLVYSKINVPAHVHMTDYPQKIDIL